MISIIARIHNSTLLYGHILTMISTSTVKRLYAQAYIRVYMYAHVTHSAWLDISHAYTVEFTVSKRTWVTFWSICIWWYLVGYNSYKIPFGPSETDHQTAGVATITTDRTRVSGYPAKFVQSCDVVRSLPVSPIPVTLWGVPPTTFPQTTPQTERERLVVCTHCPEKSIQRVMPSLGHLGSSRLR